MRLDLLINILGKTLYYKNYFLFNLKKSVSLLITNGRYSLTKVSHSLVIILK